MEFEPGTWSEKKKVKQSGRLVWGNKKHSNGTFTSRSVEGVVKQIITAPDRLRPVFLSILSFNNFRLQPF